MRWLLVVIAWSYYNDLGTRTMTCRYNIDAMSRKQTDWTRVYPAERFRVKRKTIYLGEKKNKTLFFWQPVRPLFFTFCACLCVFKPNKTMASTEVVWDRNFGTCHYAPRHWTVINFGLEKAMYYSVRKTMLSEIQLIIS